MSSIPRPNPASFLGFAPLMGFFKPAAKRSAHRVERPAPVKPAGTWPTGQAQAAAFPWDDDAPHGLDMKKLLAAAKKAPDLALIEWDGDRARFTPQSVAPAAGPASNVIDMEDPHSFDPRRRKIRDRYITARFPGVARSAADLHSVDRVIKAARLYFEEEESELALELLEIASSEVPHESPIWLARLEILFLVRDREAFIEVARAFREAHPAHECWTEVERLGRALAPGEALFGAVTGPRDHEHYGPWPNLPNWIQAPWDLTAEIAASDFHRSVKRLAAGNTTSTQLAA